MKAKHANNTAQQTRAQQQSTTQHSTAEHRAAWEYPQGDHFEKAIVSPFKGNEHNNTSNSEAHKQYSTTQQSKAQHNSKAHHSRAKQSTRHPKRIPTEEHK